MCKITDYILAPQPLFLDKMKKFKTDKHSRRTSFHKESNRHKTGQREITQIYCVLDIHILNYQTEFVISQPQKKDIHYSDIHEHASKSISL